MGQVGMCGLTHWSQQTHGSSRYAMCLSLEKSHEFSFFSYGAPVFFYLLFCLFYSYSTYFIFSFFTFLFVLSHFVDCFVSFLMSNLSYRWHLSLPLFRHALGIWLASL